MGFYSCVAKSSTGEAAWSGWLRRRGEFFLCSLIFLPALFSKLASKVVSTSTPTPRTGFISQRPWLWLSGGGGQKWYPWEQM